MGFCFLTLQVNQAAAQAPAITFQGQNLTGVSSPVDLVNADDGSDRMFIVQQDGIVRSWNRSPGATPPVFLDMGPTGLALIATGGEQGLLSLAFHPDYNGTSNRFFFVYYTNTAGNIQIARFQSLVGDPNQADPASFTPVITIDHPGRSNHNGGKLNFGPDGYLYFATGDGGGSNDPDNNAQDYFSLLGKMIRINIDATSSYGNYAVPADNPWVGNASVDERLFSAGLRNPFRWSFDRENSDIWIGDVGQSAREEINRRPLPNAGTSNYGWPCYEGLIRTPGVPTCTPQGNIFPVFQYENPTQGQAVTGGYVYRGTEFNTFRGYYIAADYISSNIFLVWPNGSGGWNSDIQPSSLNIPAFGEAEDGTLYVVGNNQVYKVIATGGAVLPVRLVGFNLRRTGGSYELNWVTGHEENTAGFHIEYSTDGRTFNRVGYVPATGPESGNSYTFAHSPSFNGTIYYRLAMEDNDRSVSYSSIIRSASGTGSARIFPTYIRDNTFNIVSQEPVAVMQLLNMAGVVVFQKRLDNRLGSLTIRLPILAKGVYLASVQSASGILVREKVWIE